MEQGNGQRHASGGFQQIVQREQGLHRSLKPAQLAMIAIGGAIGVIVALVPVVLLRAQLMAALPMRAIRWTGGGLLLLIGAGLGLAATGLL